MCRSISDIAAMGGKPLDALVTVAVRPDTEFAWLRRVYLGLQTAAQAYEVNVVGGETAKSPGPVFLVGCSDRNGREWSLRQPFRRAKG